MQRAQIRAVRVYLVLLYDMTHDSPILLPVVTVLVQGEGVLLVQPALHDVYMTHLIEYTSVVMTLHNTIHVARDGCVVGTLTRTSWTQSWWG